MYVFKWNETNGQLHKRVSGTWSAIGSATAGVADDSVVALRCEGDTITALDDGNTLRTVTDTSISTAGYAGVGMGAVITASDDVSSQDLDDYEVQELSSSSGVTTRYLHTDHLGSTNVTSDDGGFVDEVTDYYPFGEQRINTGGTTEQRKFTGHEFDIESDLTYAQQRYYDQNRGQFLSQDSVFNLVGDNKALGKRVGRSLDRILSDPQMLNSYSYARNNPHVFIDREGDIAQQWAVLATRAIILGGIAGGLGQYNQDVQNSYIDSGSVGFDTFAPQSSGAEYVAAARDGALVALGGEFFGLAGVGVAATAASAPTVIGQDYSNKSLGNAARDIAINIGGTALARAFPQVRGVDVSTFSRSFIAGSHTQREATTEGLIISLQSVVNSLTKYIETVQQNKESNKQ